MAAETSRVFACIIYPESAPDDFREIIDELHLVGFLSPLHDCDISVKTGEIEKEHYHFMCWFDGKKSLSQIKALFSKFGGVGCEIVHNKKSYVRYLCHIDKEDKVRYNEADVKGFGGALYSNEVGSLVQYNRIEVLSEIMDYVSRKKEYSFARLLLYARAHHADWFEALVSGNSHIIIEFQKSLDWTRKQEKEQAKIGIAVSDV